MKSHTCKTIDRLSLNLRSPTEVFQIHCLTHVANSKLTISNFAGSDANKIIGHIIYRSSPVTMATAMSDVYSMLWESLSVARSYHIPLSLLSNCIHDRGWVIGKNLLIVLAFYK